MWLGFPTLFAKLLPTRVDLSQLKKWNCCLSYGKMWSEKSARKLRSRGFPKLTPGLFRPLCCTSTWAWPPMGFFIISFIVWHILSKVSFVVLSSCHPTTDESWRFTRLCCTDVDLIQQSDSNTHSNIWMSRSEARHSCCCCSMRSNIFTSDFRNWFQFNTIADRCSLERSTLRHENRSKKRSLLFIS